MQKTKLLLLIAFMLCYCINLNAQVKECGFDEILRAQLKDPAKALQIKAMDEKIRVRQNAITNARLNGQQYIISGPNGNIYEIPVVFHIFERGDAQGTQFNPSDAQIINTLNYLNEVYAATYQGVPGPGNGGAETRIHFVLARRSPDCGPTTGINRIDASAVQDYAQSGVTSTNEPTLRNMSRWPRNQYVNIWVTWTIATANGYAYLPLESDVSVDGIFMRAERVNPGMATLPHEMGHVMGLYHTFQGASGATCPVNNDCTTDGDKVCDTDPHSESYSGCPLQDQINPCTNQVYGTVLTNYMSYSDNICRNRFTQGQADRMLAALTGPRYHLLSSNGLTEPPASDVMPLSCSTYTQAVNGGFYGIGARSIRLNSLQDSTTPHPGYYYTNNTCNLTTTLMATGVYNLQVFTGGTNSQRAKAWIDFNNNGAFEADEIVLNSAAPRGDFMHNVVLPADKLITAVRNTMLRMRVSSDFGSREYGACEQLQYGQVKDYGVMIQREALPVSFAVLEAHFAANTLTVNWATEMELNNKGFIVEGSDDGKTFIQLDEMPSKAKDGNSGTRLSYQYKKTLPASFSLAKIGSVAIILCMLLILMAYRKNKKWMVVPIVLITILSQFIACKKQENISTSNGNNIVNYIRIAQVDINGNQSYSKAVQVVQK